MENDRLKEGIYTDGAYLDKTAGTWHLEDSPFKARMIARMMERHPEIQPSTVCEIGCGAGGVLSGLQELLPNHVVFTGYEISPQAYAISQKFQGIRCTYVLGDAFADGLTYDLVLVMDVVEHVEDCFSFLRNTRNKGVLKLYHFPLDIHVSAILRGLNSWDSVGHIHMFSIETALKTIEFTGHRIVDWMFTEGALGTPNKLLRTRLANLLRLPVAMFSPKLAARLLGGYSMLILAE